MDRYIKNWDKFNTENENLKYTILHEKIIAYFLENERVIERDLDLFIYFILSKCGIAEEFFKRDYMLDEKEYKKIMNQIKNKEITDNDLMFHEKVYVKEILDIIKNVMKQKVYIEEDPYLIKEEVKDGIILMFKK